jgi:hypothetical protein
MRKQILFVCLSLAASQLIFSQESKSGSGQPGIGKSSFIAELGGPGIVFSANYDTRFKQSRLGVGGRVGVGFVSGWEEKYDPVTGYYDSEEITAITFPVQLNYIFGKEGSSHTFEVGGGITYVTKKMEIMNFYDENETQLFGTFCFMYRRQPINGGFSWRIGFTPLVGKGYIQAFAGASVGYNF